MARRGRPTNDPKGTMLAVRVSERHVELLEARAAHDEVSVSEALRRYLDEAVAAEGSRSKRPKRHADAPRRTRS